MQFHFDKTIEKTVCPQMTAAAGSPAWLTVCLARSLKEWFRQSLRISHPSGSAALQFGYEMLTVPISALAQECGSLIATISQTWQVQLFGLAQTGELVGLSFAERNGRLVMEQRSISGGWYENLRDLYFCMQLPDSLAANCIAQLLTAVDRCERVVVLEWEYADFLEQQKLICVDRTLSFCYVSLDNSVAQQDTLRCLSGISLAQKAALWQAFLEKHLLAPEFVWLWDAMLMDAVPNLIEWHFALYDALERQHIRFVCSGNQFALLDKDGKRLYFGIDHAEGAEQVLMKLLFPLSR